MVSIPSPCWPSAARRTGVGRGHGHLEQSTSAAETLCQACGMQRSASIPQLTSEGQQHVTALAQRYGVSTEAVVTLLQALLHGHGTMAQFDHQELGGRGQWMPGGMVMVGDMFNQALKGRSMACVSHSPRSSPLPTSCRLRPPAVPCQTRKRNTSSSGTTYVQPP